jgi:protein-tyrosine phosphatase
MAEGILKSIAKEKGLDIDVDSVGISAYDGSQASPNSIEAMKKIKIDISKHKASQLHRDLVDESDLILTLSQSHKEFILSNYPQAGDKVFTLLKYAYGEEKDVADPFGRNLAYYEKTRDEIYEAIMQFKILRRDK